MFHNNSCSSVLINGSERYLYCSACNSIAMDLREEVVTEVLGVLEEKDFSRKNVLRCLKHLRNFRNEEAELWKRGKPISTLSVCVPKINKTEPYNVAVKHLKSLNIAFYDWCFVISIFLAFVLLISGCICVALFSTNVIIFSGIPAIYVWIPLLVSSLISVISAIACFCRSTQLYRDWRETANSLLRYVDHVSLYDYSSYVLWNNDGKIILKDNIKNKNLLEGFLIY